MPRHLGPRPRLDLIESPLAYELFAELPGAGAEVVALDFSDGVLRLDVEGTFAEAAPRLEPAAPRRLWRITVGFGDLVSGADGIRAVHERGVLHVHLPKAHPADAAGPPARG